MEENIWQFSKGTTLLITRTKIYSKNKDFRVEMSETITDSDNESRNKWKSY